MRLIDANWLEDLLLMHEQNARSIEKSGKKVTFTYADGIRTGYADVGLCPTVDAEPVRHGHWMHGDEVVKLDVFDAPEMSCWCSECGDWLTGSDEYPVRGKFCPNCGAKMDEVTDGRKM